MQLVITWNPEENHIYISYSKQLELYILIHIKQIKLRDWGTYNNLSSSLTMQLRGKLNIKAQETISQI